jgi:hypothetical protein
MVTVRAYRAWVLNILSRRNKISPEQARNAVVVTTHDVLPPPLMMINGN